MGSTGETFEFRGHDGRSRLAARLHGPRGSARASVLFAHCFTCSKDSLAASRIALALVDKGFSVVRFDFTGLGASEGDFANTNFSSNVGDILAAAKGMKAISGQGPDILIGHSLGGAAVLAAAPELPSVKAVATIGAPADPAHVSHLFSEHEGKILREGKAEVRIAGRRFTIQRQFLEDIAESRVRDRLGSLGKALLILHAPLDSIVSLDNAALLFQAARHPKSFVALDGADHLLTRSEDSRYVAELVAAWAGRYLNGNDVPRHTGGEAGTPATLIPEGYPVTVEEAGDGPFRQRIHARAHTLIADEPARYGGTDKGPAPYDLLLSALGACTAMTIRLYADRKGWPLEAIAIGLRHDKIHAEDCADCEEHPRKIDRIERRIVLSGPLDHAQKARLMEIADKCPVHRSLSGSILIESREGRE